MDHLIQGVLLFVLWVIAFFLAKWVRPSLQEVLRPLFPSNPFFQRFKAAFLGQLAMVHWLIFTSIALLAYENFLGNAFLLRLASTLLLVWVGIKLAASIIEEKFWSRSISIAAWSLAALSILGILRPLIQLLDEIGLDIGEVHLSLLSILKAGLLLLLSMQVGSWLNKLIHRQLYRVPQLTPSARVLIGKTVGVLIYFIVALVVLNSVGIDFTALAVFGGALGVGIGFGLQKVVSNLISGIILLSDRSIKPGDVVQIGEVYGWISSLRGRYVSVVTRDGHEYLIPNEDLITQQVINWSFSDTRIRLKIPFGVSYKEDPHRVRALVLEAMDAMPRVLSEPPPICLLTGFGDSSVDMELRLWIDDPKNGVGNIKSDVLFKVWDVLKANGIEIPFPQRDLHVKSMPKMKADDHA